MLIYLHDIVVFPEGDFVIEIVQAHCSVLNQLKGWQGLNKEDKVSGREENFETDNTNKVQIMCYPLCERCTREDRENLQKA